MCLILGRPTAIISMRTFACEALCFVVYSISRLVIFLYSSVCHDVMEPLKLTGNFVVDNATVIQHVQENLWHLQCDRSGRLPKIRDDLPLRYEKARAKTNAGLLIVNGFELSESWPATIHEYQLQSVGNNATVEDCEAYRKGWVDLIYSEKIRQRVNKRPRQIHV